MQYWFLLPPIAFLVIFVFMWLQMESFRLINVKGTATQGKNKAYACGESSYDHHVQPDYAQFFSFAFFFTIMHVVALIIATVPTKMFSAVILAVCYLVAAVISLFILFRR